MVKGEEEGSKEWVATLTAARKRGPHSVESEAMVVVAVEGEDGEDVVEE